LKLRRQLQEELHRLQRRLGITFIYVTHDQEEALALSDRIAVMNAGRIEQIGRPQEIYERPRNRFVAQFLGACNLLEAHCSPELLVPSSEFRVQSSIGALCLKLDGPLARSQFTVTIRPEKVQIITDVGKLGENCFTAFVRDISYSGAATEYELAVGNQLLKASVGNTTPGQHSFRIGQEVRVHLPSSALIVLDD